MTALFADTFYWIALTDTTDSAHERALAITGERAVSSIVTTNEVLTEYRPGSGSAWKANHGSHPEGGLSASDACSVDPELTCH